VEQQQATSQQGSPEVVLESQPQPFVLQKPKISLHEYRAASIQSVVTDMNAISGSDHLPKGWHQGHVVLSQRGRGALNTHQQIFPPVQLAVKEELEHRMQNRTMGAKPFVLVHRAAQTATGKHANAGPASTNMSTLPYVGAFTKRDKKQPAATAATDVKANSLQAQASDAASHGPLTASPTDGSPLHANVSSHSERNSFVMKVNATEAGGIFPMFAQTLQSLWGASRQHGLLGSVYRAGEAVQPSLLLGILVVLFVVFQLAALAFVAYHAHASLMMLRKARHEDAPRGSALRELIPGISWHECVPYGTKQPGNWASQPGMRLNQSGKHSQSSSVGGGQAGNTFSLDAAVVSDRHTAPPSWASNPTKESLEKLQRSRADSGFHTRDEAWDSLESTLAVATRRADMNKRILDLLHQPPRPAPAAALGTWLDREYDALVHRDVESNLLG